MMTDSNQLNVLNSIFDWIQANYKQLEASYINLPHNQVKELPFALYCVAMYAKHQQLK
jgi:hypothetical protein